MQLLGVGGLGPGFAADPRDGVRIEAAEIGRAVGILPAPRHHRLRPALFERRVVKEGVGARRQRLERQRRGLRQVAAENVDLARLDALEQPLKPVDVHRLMEAVVDRLIGQGMVGHFALADEIFGTGDLIGKDGGDQIFGLHAQELRRDLLAAAKARQRQRDAGDPAPARREHRRVEHRLDQHRAHALRVEIAGDFGEVEAVRRGERQHDVVLGRRRLQLEIELTAEALAQRETPSAIEPAAERRVDDELHPARLVEEPLEDDPLLSRQPAERRRGRGKIVDELLGGRRAEAERLFQPGPRALPRGVGAKARVDLVTQAGCRLGEFVRPPRRLAEPERQRRRLAARVLDPHRSAFDAQDAIGRVAELEDVALQAFDGEVLVDAADDVVVRLQQHLIVGGVGDRAAGGERGGAGAAPGAQNAMDRVAMNESGAPPVAGREPLREHAHDRVEVGARQGAERPRAPQPLIKRRLVPILRRDLGDDLLGYDVERLVRDREPIEFAAPHAVEQGRAFHEVVSGEREQPPLGGRADRMAGSADALQEARDRARRADLADHVDVADVDPELERSGRDHRLQFAAFQSPLGGEAMFLGHAAVMGGDGALAEALRQFAGDALGHAARIDEDEGGAMRFDELRQPFVDLRPGFAGHHRVERRARELDGEIARALVAGVDDFWAALWRRRRGSARPPRSASAWPTGRSSAAGRRRGRPSARARGRGARRACWARRRGFRRRLPTGSLRASFARIPSRAARRAIPASSPEYAAGVGACDRARRRACRPCAPRSGSRRPAVRRAATPGGCRRAAALGCGGRRWRAP